MDIDFNELSLENIGDWPAPIKVILVSIACVLLLIAGYWFDTQHQLATLADARKKEQELRYDFEIKENQASYYESYKIQLEQMQKSFGDMLQKLPSETEVPGLLDDISEIGRSNGLQFKLFKPLPEQELEFYAELPIQISVIGSYQQLGMFVSEIANLNRIVSLNDFTLQPYNQTKDTKTNVKTSPPLSGEIVHEKLELNILAKTYRYNEHKGAAAPPAAALKGKK